MVGPTVRGLGRLPARTGNARNGHAPLRPLAQSPSRKASIRRLPSRIRFPIRLLVPDSLRRRKSLQLLRPRYQNLRNGRAEKGLSEKH